jgi:hypothetical protein
VLRRVDWRATPKRKRGLGDRTEQLLASLGVTKERYVEAKKRFGLPPTCDCPERREWLNRVGAWAAGLLA